MDQPSQISNIEKRKKEEIEKKKFMDGSRPPGPHRQTQQKTWCGA
jgi:hypothetical protein